MSCVLARPEALRRACRIGLAGVLAATALALHLTAAGVPDPDAAAAMETFLARPSVLHEYRGRRRLAASGAGRHGWLDVETRFTVASGFLYEVTTEGGSSYIRTRVLRSLLDEEQRLAAPGTGAGAGISTENYQFAPEGVNDEGLAVVGLKPRRKDRSLIAGRILLTPFEGELVRVEGRLARNPSFWVTRVNLVRSYRRINGVLMPVSLETIGQLRFLGSSSLRMTYRYSHIDRQPVGAEQVDAEQVDEHAGEALDQPRPPRAIPLPSLPAR